LKLYKLFRDHGAVIDCNIPLGERRADKTAQEAVLRRTLDELLAVAGKTMSPGAFQYLCRYTGFDPRTFAQNVEKLVDYAGEREKITEGDIQAAVERTKADPVFDLTNAVADRNLAQSLFYTQALLAAKWHPLQILSALANQMRKLLVAKSFTTGTYGKTWVAGMRYPQFQNSVMPAIEAHDKRSRDQSAAWQETICEETTKGRGKKKGATDVVLAANPKSPYPVYQTLLKSDNFSLQELIVSLQTLNQADRRLKSSAQDQSLILKKAIMEICGIASRQRL
jgi:DNA polymerase III subunit delta